MNKIAKKIISLVLAFSCISCVIVPTYAGSGETIRNEWSTPEDQFALYSSMSADSGLAALAAAGMGGVAASAALSAISVIFGYRDDVYCGVTKTYQEIYIAGEFAFFRTTITMRTYSDSGYDVEIEDPWTYVMEGTNPASI